MGTLQRHSQMIGVKPELRQEYLRLHAAVWPHVEKTITASNIRNYTIFIHHDLLIAYFECVGDDFDADLTMMGDLIYSEQALSLLTRSRGLSAASHLVNEAIASGLPFADAVPVNLSNEPVLRLSDSIVDSSIARHREALQHRLRTQRTP